METQAPSSETPIDIRRCLPSDLAAIQAIYAHYVLTSTATFEETPPGLDYWQQRYEEIDLLGLPFLVAEIDHEVIGYSFCSRWRPRPAYRFSGEDSIYVAPQAVGRGVGSVLLPSLIAECRAASLREIVAVIATGGTDASVRLHKRNGFRDAGRLTRVGFKFGRWHDTMLLQLSLAEDPDSVPAPA